MTTTLAMGLTLFASFIGAFGAVLLKQAAEKISFRKFRFTLPFVAACGIYGLSTLLFITALKQGELSILYPIVATTYAWIAIFSSYFLKEKLTPLKIAGIAAILVGVSMIGLSA